jgi:hypothetical protein
MSPVSGRSQQRHGAIASLTSVPVKSLCSTIVLSNSQDQPNEARRPHSNPALNLVVSASMLAQFLDKRVEILQPMID